MNSFDVFVIKGFTVVGFMIEMSRVQVLRMSRVQVRKEKGLGEE